jgi:hypothetical protein
MINLTNLKIDTIMLEQMDKVKLMNRVDTKFCINISNLPILLNLVSDKYYALIIKGEKELKYSTTYFDTINNLMYNTHLRGKKNRYKLRKRTYEIQDKSYLEIKFKTNKGQTKKKRITTLAEHAVITDEENIFLEQHSPFTKNELKPVLNNSFTRLMLVNKNLNERCTIDYNLCFNSCGNSKHLSDIAIIEVKTEGRDKSSPMFKELRKLRTRSTGFSKYCYGRSIIDNKLKNNRYREKIRHINKLVNGGGAIKISD